MTFTTVYLALGGNVPSRYGSPENTIKSALNEIGNLRGVERGSFRISRFYETEPVIVPGEPLSRQKSGNYVNAACAFKTNLSVVELFRRLESIERSHDKYLYFPQKGKNDPRPIDIDLLFYGDFVGRAKLPAGNVLQIPHTQWDKRLFVLVPLCDVTKFVTLRDSNSPTPYISQMFDIGGMINVLFAAKQVKSVALIKHIAPITDIDQLIEAENGKRRRNSFRNADEMALCDDVAKSERSPHFGSVQTRASSKRNSPRKGADEMDICDDIL
jgi:2-amino-4-hydroxy-6-hydroxymethyldihydropteridine diphosphokinase